MMRGMKTLNLGAPAPSAKISAGPAKLGTVIANRIEQEIVKAGWPIGTVIATEAELAAQYAVSRATVREAVGQIERRGIAVMRRGNRGGLFVSAPARPSIVRSLATYIELANTDLDEVLEARGLLEGRAAALACERIDAAGIKGLEVQARNLSTRTGDIEDDVRMHIAIREAIAEATGNPLLALLIEAMDFSSKEVTIVSTEDPQAYREVILQAIGIKQELVQAIIDCDPVAAQNLAHRDISLQRAGYRETRRSPPRVRKNRVAGLKLAHSLAILISQEIRSNQWQPGQKIGAEAKLIKQYDVSRSAFREAIRLLQSLSVVQMLRGGEGGLVVGVPDPTHIIESAARFIDYMGLRPAHVHEVREALELGAVHLAAQAATPEDITEMRDALAAAENAVTPEEMRQKPMAVHLAISRASHNQVISLLTQLVLRAVSKGFENSRLSSKMVQEVLASHRLIIDAIACHESGTAKRMMLQHLTMIKEWAGDRRGTQS
jgi:DNA-binding FadR family transcriptional regulator